MRFVVESSLAQEAAFAAVADFARFDEWDPAVANSRLVAGTALAPGSLYQLTAPRWLGRVVLEYELLAIEPPHYATYRGGSQRVSSTDTMRVSPSPEGSRVAIESQLSTTGRARWLMPLISALVWVVGRSLSLPALKRRLNPKR